MQRQVVITGFGAVTPLGNTVRETWEALCAGKSGIGEITKFDTRDFETKIAGEIKNFDPLSFVNKKELRHLDDFIIYANYAHKREHVTGLKQFRKRAKI